MKLNSIIPPQSLLPGAALLALLLQGCGSQPQDIGAASVEVVPTVATDTASNRRVFEGCDSAEAAKEHADMVGEDVLISWAWIDASEQMNALEVPASVLRVESSYMVVAFNPDIPNVEFYSAVWLTSGHIKAMPDGAFGVDMCSATVKKGKWQ